MLDERALREKPIDGGSARRRGDWHPVFSMTPPYAYG
jgi:hypothetical protein